MCLYVFHHLSADPKQLGRFLCHFISKTVFRARFWAGNRAIGSFSGSQLTCMGVTPLSMTCLYVFHHLSGDPKQLGRFLCHFSTKTVFRARFWDGNRVLGSFSGSQLTCMSMTPLNMTCLYDLHHLSADPKRWDRFLCHFSYKTVFRARHSPKKLDFGLFGCRQWP